MIVLEQNHVKQSDAMIYSATYFYRFFLHHSHARGRFASVKYAGIGSFQFFYVFGGHGCDTTHALHDV